MKPLDLNQRQVLIGFRLIISMLLFFFAVYARKSQMTLLMESNLIYWVLGLAGIQLDRLFDPLVSLKSDVTLGFGIAVAKNWIDKHNGKITIENLGAGPGTRVLIHLPWRAETKGGQNHARQELAAA